MKTIKRVLVGMLLFTSLLAGCSKEEDSMISEPSTQNVSLEFGAVLNDLANKVMNKTIHNQLPNCNNGVPKLARITVSYNGEARTVDLNILSDGTTYYTDYSEELKIPVKVSSDGDDSNDFTKVTLSEFLVYDANPDNGGKLVWIAPKGDSDFSGYVDKPLPFDITVRPGTKKYVELEVLCFDERMANEYGYLSFVLTTEKLFNLCFFANYCDDNGRHYPANYSIDLFVLNEDGEQIQIYAGGEHGTMPDIGQYDDGEYFGRPLCLAVPGPPDGVAGDEDYLFYTIIPEDWESLYGNIDNIPLAAEGLNWNEVQALYNDDGETQEYIHILINCEEVSACGEFETIPESSFYDSITPENPVDYFEIVTYLDEIIFSFSQGELCADAEDIPNCINEFEMLIAEDGFVISCLPAGCYTFIRQQVDGVNQLITNDEELLEFLGIIDSKGDALLLALANDYYWNINDIENGAIKEACDGYELIVSKIVSSCTPLQIDRFHLRITHSGQIIILDQEVIEYEENICI
ncbi:hypothetical protein [Christiangramia forsetii]|nr:hypothetical protein [Christiangramia forsetii]